MADRIPTIGGNWKMNLNPSEAVELIRGLAQHTPAGVEVVVYPAFTHLAAVWEELSPPNAGSTIALGAQNAWPEPNGAYTGEVSLQMLQDVGVSVVLVGHSERRHVIGESDVLINRKLHAALDAGCNVVLAIGEKLEQREAGQTDAINRAQLAYGLAGVTAEQMQQVVIAYEPVWAIGTGKTATPEDAQKAHAAIRRCIAEMYDPSVADAVRIQYGGSMKPGNAAELLAQPDIDGGLIGGASLNADDFLAILNAAV